VSTIDRDTRDALRNRIELQWLRRAHNLYPPSPSGKRTAAYNRAEVEFFAGAMAAADAADKLFNLDPGCGQNNLSSLVPPAWVFNVIRGDPVVNPKDYNLT
jgi:hypothetical protein